jgi:tetratricopeptide (TPR) repeat protein
VTREGALNLVAGLLIGFLVGYWVQEGIAARQPPRLPAPPAAPAAGGAAGAGGAAEAAMEEVQRLRNHVEQNPADVDAILRLAQLNLGIGNWPRAAELFERVLELRPDDPAVLADLSVCYRETGRIDEALARLAQAKQVAPDHWPARFQEVVTRVFYMGDLDGARQPLDELLRLQPGNAQVRELAAEVERLRGAA